MIGPEYKVTPKIEEHWGWGNCNFYSAVFTNESISTKLALRISTMQETFVVQLHFNVDVFSSTVCKRDSCLFHCDAAYWRVRLFFVCPSVATRGTVSKRMHISSNFLAGLVSSLFERNRRHKIPGVGPNILDGSVNCRGRKFFAFFLYPHRNIYVKWYYI